MISSAASVTCLIESELRSRLVGNGGIEMEIFFFVGRDGQTTGLAGGNERW